MTLNRSFRFSQFFVLILACFGSALAAEERTDFKFAFGPGRVAEGYTQVLPMAAYTKELGYGFDLGTVPTAVDRGGADALHGGFATSDQPREPGASWGQMLTRFLKPDVAVANHAESGETLKSFITGLRLAKCIVQGIRDNKLDLAQFIVDDFTGFDPAKPDPVESFSLPASPGRMTEAPRGN